MKLSAEILAYIEDHRQEAFDLLVQLAQIPAPSNHEERRAEFCRNWLRGQGAEGVYIDEALNVVYPVGCTADNDLMVFMAHSDVVFPDTDPLPLKIEDGKIFCPGIADDTANVVALLMAAKYIAQTGITPKDCGLLLIVNSGEEGLGNLKGSRLIMEHFGSRIKEFITFDGLTDALVDRAVGSMRYRICVATEGGHSFNDFGNRNAIACLASMINTLYTVTLPEKGKTTYNVGLISGGTSVNTIAQNAQMLYEFRSDARDSLAYMEQFLMQTLEDYRAKGVTVDCQLIGNRPCGGDVDPAAQETLTRRAAEVTKQYYGTEPECNSGSTDCNIPLSMGIPSVCVGCVRGKGAHTREEEAEIASLLPGLRVAFSMILKHF